jgi:hypothetical protein
MMLLEFWCHSDSLWHTKSSMCTHKVTCGIRQRRFKFTFFKSGKIEFIKYDWLSGRLLVKPRERLAWVWWTILLSHFASHRLPVASSEWLLLAILQRFRSMSRNVETGARRSLQFSQNYSPRTHVKFAKSLWCFNTSSFWPGPRKLEAQRRENLFIPNPLWRMSSIVGTVAGKWFAITRCWQNDTFV